jgi:hypothetical protein
VTAAGLAIVARARRAIAAWFAAETHPVNLAVARITVFWILFEVLREGGFRRYARLPAELRVPPPGWEPILRAFPLDETSVTAAQIAGAVFAFLALVGLWTRPAAALATLFGTWVLVTPYLFGKVDHHLHHIVWFGILLAASPSGDALSVDAWLARRRGRPPPGPARAYALPIRMMWLLIGCAYFFAGLYKLLAGPDWVLSEHFRFLLYESWSHKRFLPALRIDLFPLLYRSAAAATILFELSFVFLILSRRTRRLAALAGLFFHAMTAYYLHIYFVALMLCYVVFVDWYALAHRLGFARRPTGPRAAPPAATAASVAGSLLLAVQVAFGALAIDSWPFAVYPRFDRIRTQAARSRTDVMLESASGSERLRVQVRSTSLGRTVALPPGEERDRRLLALVESALAKRGPLEPGQNVRIYSSTYSTRPGDWRAPPLHRELLFDYLAARDAELRHRP